MATQWLHEDRGQIAAYQVWHEPNLAAHWGGQYVDPVAYLGLLREAAVQIRTADPGAVVVAAAIVAPRRTATRRASASGTSKLHTGR